MHHLSRRDARRIAVRAQLLARPRPTSLLETMRGLTAIQVDLTSHVAPNVDLVLWSRLGTRFDPAELDEALTEREVVEVRGFLRPADDVALFKAEMDAWPGPDPQGWAAAQQRWVEANDATRDELLQVLRSEGPLPARDLPQDFRTPWRSSGWNNNKNTIMLLERLEERGEVAVSHREGRERIWDLAERIHPDVTPVPIAEALRIRAERRLASLGLARATGPACPVEPQDVGEVGELAQIDGVRGRWRVWPALLDTESRTTFQGRTAVISPLDRLIFDRKRMDDLFAFDYTLEMYKPAATRRWGYFALPVLHGDDFVGKVDCEADRKGGFLRVHALHEDEPWSPSLRDEVEAELLSLATLLGLGIEYD